MIEKQHIEAGVSTAPRPSLLSEYRNYPDIVEGEDYIFIQPKIDGWRCVVNTRTGKLYSRTGNEINLPHISADVIGRDLPEYLDGELYATGFTLGQIQGMIRRGDKLIQFHMFDIINARPQHERLESLQGIAETENIKRVPTYKIAPAELHNYYHAFLSQGMEGAVIRLPHGRYTGDRTNNVLKMKPEYD
ncbi:MAG: hypothetical protein JW807_16675 [Spirochaetes bacterium]|nr:hypothetical protein [Spirochaetota bacterium]